MAAHTLPHMSPAQAAQAAGVSRWAVMRAINSHKLKASRDNQNHWRIAPEDLEAWAAHNVRSAHSAHPETEAELREKIAALTADNGQLRERLSDTQEDRNAWREMAQKRRSWWPW